MTRAAKRRAAEGPAIGRPPDRSANGVGEAPCAHNTRPSMVTGEGISGIMEGWHWAAWQDGWGPSFCLLVVGGWWQTPAATPNELLCVAREDQGELSFSCHAGAMRPKTHQESRDHWTRSQACMHGDGRCELQCGLEWREINVMVVIFPHSSLEVGACSDPSRDTYVVHDPRKRGPDGFTTLGLTA